jgi:hypothetical protein
MADYYFDIETHTIGDKIDFNKDPIITIQYQMFDTRTGIPKNDLVILKSWESNEEDVLKKFYQIFNPENTWAFMPTGFNLSYDFTKLLLRWKLYNINIPAKLLFCDHPSLDIRPLVILMNNGMMKGATLENFAGKACSGDKVKEWYETKNYNAITDYIQNETKCFLKMYQYLIGVMPNIAKEYAKLIG